MYYVHVFNYTGSVRNSEEYVRSQVQFMINNERYSSKAVGEYVLLNITYFILKHKILLRHLHFLISKITKDYKSKIAVKTFVLYNIVYRYINKACYLFPYQR